MKVRLLTRLLAAASLLAAFALPGAAHAELVTLHVQHSGPFDSTHFGTIQEAIVQAHTLLANPTNQSTFEIEVKADPAPYSGAVTIQDDGVPIHGTLTAGTFLSGGGNGPLIATGGHKNLTIRNFTFQATPLAIAVSGGSDVHITNCVFNLGSGATAIQITSATSSSVVNNTFFNNGTAISTNAADLTIDNDIFMSNAVAIATSVTLNNLLYNDYYLNASNGVSNLGTFPLPNAVTTNANPLFVDAGGGDFHLLSGSPCKGSGDPNVTGVRDRGAYGGPNSDPLVPSTVTGLTASVTSASSTTPPVTVSLTWDESGDSTVTGYRVYYGTTPTSVTAAEGASPLLVTPRTTRSATLTFDTLPAAPQAPTGQPALVIVSKDRSLQLNWSAVTGATGYMIFYNPTSSYVSSPVTDNRSVTVQGGNTTSYLLANLTNGVTYTVQVQPFAQPQVSVQVTAVVDTTQPSSPGTTNESSLSPVQSVPVGSPVFGVVSAPAQEFPEAVAPFPDVKGGGCFIATAAYGFYSAPEVQALRLFRDRFLMTNASGRAFVAWYYRHGPAGAGYLNAHPWMKVPVRVVLFPLVVLSAFLVYTTPAMKIAIVIAVVVAGGCLYRRTESFSTLRARRLS